MRMLFAMLVLCVFADRVMAQDVIAGRLNVPADILPHLAGASISSLYGTPIAQTDPEGRFTIPVSLSGDVDILFVKQGATNDVVLLGYAFDHIVNIGLESTALAMLMMFNPVNGSLDLNSKKALLTAYRENRQFPQLVDAVRKTVGHQGSVTTPTERAMTQIMVAIQDTTPRPRQTSALYDPMMLMAR